MVAATWEHWQINMVAVAKCGLRFRPKTAGPPKWPSKKHISCSTRQHAELSLGARHHPALLMTAPRTGDVREQTGRLVAQVGVQAVLHSCTGCTRCGHEPWQASHCACMPCPS